MLIHSIIIYDYIEQKVNKFDFNSKVNILVTQTNTIGKSSLIKSIYHCLGFNIKIWPDGWNSKNMIFQLEVSKNLKSHLITRQNDLFYIDNREEILTEKEFSKWLQESLSIKIKLKDKKTKSLVDVYPSEVILPFYIDQDKSWNGYIHSKTSDSFSRYTNTVKNIFDFYFDFNNEKLINLEIKKSELEYELSTIQKKLEAFKLLENDHLVVSPPIYSIENNDDLSENSMPVNYHLNRINEINSFVIEINKNNLKLESHINQINQEISELNKLKELYHKKFNEIKHTCIHCNSKLTKEQSLKRLKIRNNNLEILEQIDKNMQEKSIYQSKLKEQFKKKEEFLAKNGELESSISLKKEYSSLNNYIEDRVNQGVNKKYSEIEHNLIITKDAKNTSISKIKKSILAEKKIVNDYRDKIKKRYEELLNDYKLHFKDILLDDVKFYSFKEVTGSGMDANKKMLALYTLYANLINEFSETGLPLAMDSFIKNESAIELKDEMFGFLSKYYLTINSQIFFSIIKENVKYLDQDLEYNFIDLKKPILEKVNEENKSLLDSFSLIDN